MNSSEVCIDASLAVAWLTYDLQSQNANVLLRQWRKRGVQMIGPPLFHPEVTSAIRQHVYFERILPEEGEEAFLIYLGIPIRIIDGPEVYRKAWQLAKEFNLPVCYDMQYLAVAELEDCELWTADRKLFNRINVRNPRVHCLGQK